MARSRQPRYRNSTTGTPAVKIIAILACLGTAGAAAIFVANGKIDLSQLTGGIKSSAKDDDSTAEQKDEQEAIGIASLESSSTDEATEDTGGETKTAAATNPFEDTEATPPPAKPHAKKHHKQVAERDEQPADEVIDWEQAAAPSKKAPTKPPHAKRSDAASSPPGIAELDAEMTPPDVSTLEDTPRTLPKAEPKRLKRLPPHQQPERKSAFRQYDRDLLQEEPAQVANEPADSEPVRYGQLPPPKGDERKNSQPPRLNDEEIAEFQKENDDSAAFRRIQRVKDERIATKPDNEPAIETLDVDSSALTAPETDIDLVKTRKLTAEGEEKQAHRLLSEWYWKYPAKRSVLQKDLDELAQRIYFSPQPYYGEPYEIQPGDQLARIAKQHNVSWQYLARLNQVQPKKLRAGKKLKVFQGPFLACVDLSDFELTIHQNGLFIKKYKVGIGKENSSPIGEFVVKEKLENPTYYGPDGDVKDANDPLNPLGERWIDIGNSFGIHGTIEPDTVGKSASRGCIRMLNSDIEEVYDLLTTGSRVRIQR